MPGYSVAVIVKIRATASLALIAKHSQEKIVVGAFETRNVMLKEVW